MKIVIYDAVSLKYQKKKKNSFQNHIATYIHDMLLAAMQIVNLRPPQSRYYI